MPPNCLHKEFFALGTFAMFLIYFWLEVIRSVLEHKTIKNNFDYIKQK